MKQPDEKELAWRLTSMITDAFNQSIGALEDAGALDTKKMRKHYTGIGSKYYDIVTQQIEVTVRSRTPWICELFTQEDDASNKK